MRACSVWCRRRATVAIWRRSPNSASVSSRSGSFPRANSSRLHQFLTVRSFSIFNTVSMLLVLHSNVSHSSDTNSRFVSHRLHVCVVQPLQRAAAVQRAEQAADGVAAWAAHQLHYSHSYCHVRNIVSLNNSILQSIRELLLSSQKLPSQLTISPARVFVAAGKCRWMTPTSSTARLQRTRGSATGNN